MAYSGQSRIAFDHGFNDALFGRDRDNPYNISVIGLSHAAYEEGYEIGLISDAPPRGPQGDQGEKGDKGDNGEPGEAGNQHRIGNGVPGAGLGSNGDIYTDVSTGSMYSKSGGVWSLVGTLQTESDQARLMRYFLGE